jgi:hypothetical protein
MIENVHATGAILASVMTGLPGFDIEDVTLSNIRVDTEEAGSVDWVAREIPELPKAYPNAKGFGRMPAHGLYCRHMTGVRLRNIEFKSATGEARPAIVCDDVKDLEIDGLRSLPIAGMQPVVKLIQTRNALVQNGSAPSGTNAFLEIAGDKSEGIVLTASNLLAAKQSVQAGPEVPKGSVTASGNLYKT